MATAEEHRRYGVLALYQFLPLDQLESLQQQVRSFLEEQEALGTILLATEGVNGTICYPIIDENTTNETILTFFRTLFPPLTRTRLSYSDQPVFFRLKVRLKQEIVTLGVPSVDLREHRGQYVQPQDWDRLTADPDTLVIDTRNDYEVQIGTFAHAVDPQTTSFTEFPAWMERQLASSSSHKPPKQIAMFCTGGIRCEKATAWVQQQLSSTNNANIPVYHLEGGILAYLATIPPEQSSFRGECYVFDQRTAVTHGLEPSHEYTLCKACRKPLSSIDRQHEDHREGSACLYCVDDPEREERRQRYVDRHKQLAREKSKKQRRRREDGESPPQQDELSHHDSNDQATEQAESTAS